MQNIERRYFQRENTKAELLGTKDICLFVLTDFDNYLVNIVQNDNHQAKSFLPFIYNTVEALVKWWNLYISYIALSLCMEK